MNIKSNIFLLIIAAPFFLSTKVSAQDKSPPADVVDETEIRENVEQQTSESVVHEVVVDEDEFPSESVTPVTDNNASIINKKIKFSKRFQLDINTGSVLDEPIVNANYFLFRASYYTDEEYSFGIGSRTRFGDRTTYSEQLYRGSAQLEFNRAPSPTQSHFLSLGYNFYYGKISLSKKIVTPATTKLEVDFGMQSFGASNLPFLQSAINQSFFINKHLSFGVIIGLSMAQILDPTSVNIRSTQPQPSASSFANKIQFNQYLSLNVGMIF